MLQSTDCPCCNDRRDGYSPSCPTCAAELAEARPRYLFQYHGGSSYAGFGNPEPADSLDDIRWTMERRDGGDSYYPCTEGASAWIYAVNGDLPGLLQHLQSGDHYPDRVATIGPRGGVRIERA